MTHSAENHTYIENGHLRGKPNSGRRAYYVELIRQVMLELKLEPVIYNVPFARGIRELGSKDNIAFFNVTRTAQREREYLWVLPLMQTSSYFFENSNTPTRIKTIDDARRVSAIGVLRGGVYENSLQSLGFPNIVPMESYPQILSMLERGRINLTLSAGDFTTLNYLDPNFKIVQRTEVKVTDYTGYLCFSKNVSKDVVKQWQSAYAKVKARGQVSQLQVDFLQQSPIAAWASTR